MEKINMITNDEPKKFKLNFKKPGTSVFAESH